MKNNNLWFTSHTFAIALMFLCNFNIGIELLAQETENNFDFDNNGFFESVDFDQHLIIQDYSVLLDTGDVIHWINTPAGNSQGLTWDGTNLWVSDISTSMIYKVDPSDGGVISSFDAPGASTEGLAWDGTNLWATDNHNGPPNPQMLYKIDPDDGTILSSVELDNSSWAHGITWDGEYIWVDNFGPKTITKVDQASGEILHTFPTPGTGGIGLTWDGEYLWVDDFNTDLLYQLNPLDGSVIYTVNSPHDNPRDLAWDGQYLWVLAANASKIYQIGVGYVTNVEDSQLVEDNIGEISVSPNPFNKKLNLEYNLYVESQLSVTIHSLEGKLMTTLYNQIQKKGNQTLNWDGTNSTGQVVPNGLYFCRFISKNSVHTEKVFFSR